MRRMKRRLAALLVLLATAMSACTATTMSRDIEGQLRKSEYVYISSTRKDGTLGEAAEIWFLYHRGAVYVGTRPTSWRVKRINAGRPRAKIWVGKRDGPSFWATGKLVDDDAIEALLMSTYAEKYPDGWKKYAENFRKGFVDGSRVVVKYSPTGD